MPNPEPPSPRRRRNVAVLRTAGFVAAVVLGVIAVWLIVTGTTQKTSRIGVLAGLWALLLGAFAVYGSRSPGRDQADAVEAALAEHTAASERSTQVAQQALAEHAAAARRSAEAAERASATLTEQVSRAENALAVPPAAGELDVRRIGEIERAAVARARAEFRAELQGMLRHEVEAGVAHEVAALRAEVAALRNELVEKVGGQLRLERIETTRLIGSDLEALQYELRRLRETTGDPDGHPVAASHGSHQAGRVGPIVDVEPEDAELVGPEVIRMLEPGAVTMVEPAGAGLITGSPAPELSPVLVPPAAGGDPAPAGRPQRADGIPFDQHGANDRHRTDDRHRADPSDVFVGLPRLSPFIDDAPEPTPAPVASGGGRRHRADDSDDDVLSRILARERH